MARLNDFKRFNPQNGNRKFRVIVDNNVQLDNGNYKDTLLKVLDTTFEKGVPEAIFNSFRNERPNTRYYWSGRRLLSTHEEIEQKAQGSRAPDDTRARFILEHPFTHNNQQYYTHGEIGDYCIVLFGWLNYDLREMNIQIEPRNFTIPQELKEIEESDIRRIVVPGGNAGNRDFPAVAEDSGASKPPKSKGGKGHSQRHVLVYVCRKGEIGLDSFTADGLVIIGEGYGDPEHSGLDEMFGLPDDDDFRLYKCGEEGAPYRYAYYVATDYDRPWIPVEKLLGKGCRSIIIDFSRNMPDDFRISIPRLLREHGHFIVVPSAG